MQDARWGGMIGKYWADYFSMPKNYISHPTTGEIQTFESKLPEELQKFMDILVKA